MQNADVPIAVAAKAAQPSPMDGAPLFLGVCPSLHVNYFRNQLKAKGGALRPEKYFGDALLAIAGHVNFGGVEYPLTQVWIDFRNPSTQPCRAENQPASSSSASPS